MDKRPKELWFGNKKHGYGWYPITWQGWVLILIYLITVIGIGLLIDSDTNLTLANTFGFGFLALLATFILFYITIQRAPKPKWQWGSSHIQNKTKK